MTIAMSGSGHAAMECAVFNTVEPGESVLVAINGIWGERVAEIAERSGASLLGRLTTLKKRKIFSDCAFYHHPTSSLDDKQVFLY